MVRSGSIPRSFDLEVDDRHRRSSFKLKHAPQGALFFRPLFDLHAAVAHQIAPAELQLQRLSRQKVRSGLLLLGVDVQMRLGRIPRIPDPPQELPSSQTLPGFHLNAELHEMRQQDPRIAALQENKVAGRLLPIELRGLEVGPAVFGQEHLPVTGRVDRLTENLVPRRLSGPDPSGAEPEGIEFDDIECVALAAVRPQALAHVGGDEAAGAIAYALDL